MGWMSDCRAEEEGDPKADLSLGVWNRCMHCSEPTNRAGKMVLDGKR
jgi:hypothetical protein